MKFPTKDDLGYLVLYIVNYSMVQPTPPNPTHELGWLGRREGGGVNHPSLADQQQWGPSPRTMHSAHTPMNSVGRGGCRGVKFVVEQRMRSSTSPAVE